MRILYTGDWQLSFHNLDKAKQMVGEILSICAEHKVDMIVNLGDVKEVYNPIDVRVVNFAVKTFSMFKQRNTHTVVVLGNHDRVGMYTDSQNWLPVLERAGALVYDKPERVSLDGKTHLHILPFMTDKEALKKAAKQLAKDANPKTDILVFHEELKGVRFNLSQKSDNGTVRGADLFPDKYMFCIGGHIHLQQRMGQNIWYAGSPFAMDWGEVNQRKGYLLVDTKNGRMTQLRSRIPALYDPVFPGFKEARPKNWSGAEVRIHVPYDKTVTDIHSLISKSRVRAEKDYPGAIIVPVVEYVSDEEHKTDIDANTSDEELVQAYVDQTLWDNLKDMKPAVGLYLSSRLKEVGIKPRARTSIEFLRAKVRNFLSFKELDLDYTQKGVTVLLGTNKDWKNKSNGSGKTSALQPPAVAMFGSTFKGQVHDKWARRGTLKKSLCVLVVRTANGKKHKIIRCRRPHKLKFLEWNEDKKKWRDISTGNRPKQTELLIEETLGFTWETLANSIYIDQAKTNVLLGGTDGARKKLLERFQNLERYKVAQDLVKKDLAKLDANIADTEREIESCTTTIAGLKEAADDIDVSVLKELEEKLDQLKVAVAKKTKQLQAEIDGYEKKGKKLSKEYDKLKEDSKEIQTAISKAKGKMEALEERLTTLKGLGNVCPTCEQEVDKKILHKTTTALAGDIAKVKGKRSEDIDKSAELDVTMYEIYQEMNELELEVQSLTNKIEKANEGMEEIQTQIKNMTTSKETKDKLLVRIRKQKKKRKLLREDLENKRADRSFYEYCIEVFSRKGLPAFLNALVVPQLNKAAEYYSKLFADGAIQVRFTAKEGDFDVKVVNAYGGEDVADQSQGELKMASLITSFALRDATLKSNLLILDEPGDGLDESNARRFAESIREIAPRFGSVWLTTHNQAIASELSGERTITIVKSSGISRVA